MATGNNAGGSLKGTRSTGQYVDEAAEFVGKVIEDPDDFNADERLLSVYNASIIAKVLHAQQVDKIGRPYHEHLACVATGVRAMGGDDDDVIAAWFHDSIEDDKATYEVLRTLGVTTTSLDTITAVTKIALEPNEVSLDRVLDGGPRAQRLKLADLFSNTRHDRVAALRLQAGSDVEAMLKIDRRLATYQRWIQAIMVELGLLPAEVGHP